METERETEEPQDNVMVSIESTEALCQTVAPEESGEESGT